MISPRLAETFRRSYHTMSSYRFPGGPAMESAESANFLVAPGDRRALLKRAAGIGLALPALGALGLQTTGAQDEPEHG